ncbi:MAG: TetR/AcrR family transcriptional regulator [Steroidobacteraceae bacterium]
MLTPKLRLGRPVDRSIDRAVVDTVLLELKHRGYRSITMEGISRKIGRARASLYRRWPSKPHLVAYAVVSELGSHPSPDTGSLRLDLMRTVETLITGFQGALGTALAGLIGEMADDPVLARIIRKEVLAKRRRSIRAAFRRGIKRGEVRSDVNVELFMDMLTAPFYFRALLGHLKVSALMIETVVDTVLCGAAAC